MSVCGQTEEDSASEEQPAGTALREMYEQKAVSKVVRVLTVLAYLLSVSLAAILLSVYYVCVWKSPDLPPLDSAQGQVDARRADPPYPHMPNHTQDSLNQTRGGNSTVSDEGPTPTPPVDPPSLPASSEPPDAPTMDPPNSTLSDFNATWFLNNATDQR